MKLFQLAFVFLISTLSISLCAQDTFSIVAVDKETGEVGSAGATCLDKDDIATGALVISKMIPGVGSINTQSFYLAANQVNANTKLQEGLNAQEIIDWLEANDVGNDPAVRQYGVAVLDSDGVPSAAGFTGVNCFDTKLHTTGEEFSIQGNILISEDVITNMEANFLNTNGPLAYRLMAALQGANIPGADSRCLNEGVSSLSAFVRVAKPNDVEGNYYLDLLVDKTPFGEEPIDSLQNLFDSWSLIDNAIEVPVEEYFSINPNPVETRFTITYKRYKPRERAIVEIRDPTGKITQIIPLTNETTDVTLVRGKIPSGQYFYSFSIDGFIIKQSSFIVINK